MKVKEPLMCINIGPLRNLDLYLLTLVFVELLPQCGCWVCRNPSTYSSPAPFPMEPTKFTPKVVACTAIMARRGETLLPGSHRNNPLTLAFNFISVPGKVMTIRYKLNLYPIMGKGVEASGL